MTHEQFESITEILLEIRDLLKGLYEEGMETWQGSDNNRTWDKK